MEPFTILQAGGRQKFLKKKKQKKIKVQTQSKQANYIIIIQKNIQRFLQYKRVYSCFENKMQIEQDQEKNTKDLLQYWVLTEYHMRACKLQRKMFQFWKYYKKNQNQILNEHEVLLVRMSNLALITFELLIKQNLNQSVQICKQMVFLMKIGKLKILKKQVNIILNSLRKIDQLDSNYNITKLRNQLIDIIIQNQANVQIRKQIFANERNFEQYLMRMGQQKQKMKYITKMIVQFYPLIFQTKIKRILENQEQTIIMQEQHLNIKLLYKNIIKYLYDNNFQSQQLLIIMSFLKNLSQKIKEKILQDIVKQYKIDLSIFQSFISYKEYLQEKKQYQILKQQLIVDYNKGKLFISKSLNIILDNKVIQSSLILKQQALKYIFQLISMFGQNIQMLPMNKSINLIIQNVSQSEIYQIGNQNSFSKKNNQISSQSMLALLLTIANKSAEQTPDLYFQNFYKLQSQKQKLKKVIKQYLLKILKHTMFLPKSSEKVYKITKITTLLLQNLYNKIFRTAILPTQIFQNASFINKFKNYQIMAAINDQIMMFLNKFPYIFPLSLRFYKFKQILRKQRNNYYGNFYNQSDDEGQYHSNHIKIRRNYQFADAFDQMKKRNLKKYFKVTFINQLGFQQAGVDAGGLKKQFLNRVFKNVLNPLYGMFIENQSHELLPHPTKAQQNDGIFTEYYEFIGKLIGLAIYQNITLGYKFSGAFLNAIVGKKNTFDDLKKIDYDVYKSLIYIKNMEQDARQLGLTFMYKDETRNKHIQLIPDGHLIQVTNQNKLHYISLLTAYKVNKIFEFQTRFIRKGLTSMINKECLFMFNYEQLNYLISGQGQINIQDLKANTKLIGFSMNDVTIKVFWEVVNQFSQDQKSKLLMFVTACPRPSFLGFQQLTPPFTIVKIQNKQSMLPISHTCSNIIELPDYKNKDLLKMKILTAIESNSGFQFG